MCTSGKYRKEGEEREWYPLPAFTAPFRSPPLYRSRSRISLKPEDPQRWGWWPAHLHLLMWQNWWKRPRPTDGLTDVPRPCASAESFAKNWTELVHSEDNMQELQIHGVETAIWKGGKTKFPEFPPTIHSTYTYTCTIRIMICKPRSLLINFYDMNNN